MFSKIIDACTFEQLIGLTDLVCSNFHNHFSEQIGWATRPPVLLVPEGLESAGQFTFHLALIKFYIDVKNSLLRDDRSKCHEMTMWYLEVSQVEEFPALETSSHCKIHVLHCGSIFPPSCVIYGTDSPYSTGSWHRFIQCMLCSCEELLTS